MTRALLLALALLSGSAEAQFLPDGIQSMPSGKKSPVVFSFTAPAAGSYASITPTVGGAITCSRPSSGTYQTSATTLATATSNQCRVDYRGLMGEGPTTNYVLQSLDVSNAAWTSTNALTITPNSCVAPSGTTTMALVNSTGQPNNSNRYQGVTVASTTGPFAVHSWVVPTSGSHTGSVGVACAGAAAVVGCTCQVSSGTCTATAVGGNNCIASTTTSSLVHLYAISSCASASTSVFGFVEAGVYGTSVDSICFGTAQIEVLGFGSSNIDTTTTAVARSADVNDEGARTLSATPSMSATVNLEGLPASGTAVALDATDGTNAWKVAINPAGTVTCTYGAGSDTTVGTVAAGTPTKVACSYDGTTLKACVAGTCHGTAVALSPVSAFTHLYLGSDGTANFLNGFASTACAGRTTGACPP